MIDMDNFKGINDTYGHSVGDRYLKELGKILSSLEHTTAFRFGGDEFCLLFTTCTLDEVKQCCLFIQKSFSHSEVCCEVEPMGLSMGIARNTPGMQPSVLLQKADSALYQAKKNKGSIVIYEDGQ